MTIETTYEKVDKYILFFNALGYEPDVFFTDDPVIIHVPANLDIPEELLGSDTVAWRLDND